MPLAYQEFIDFIACGTTPSKLVAFQPSAKTRLKVEKLIHREKTIGLTSAQRAELDDYMQLEHLLRLAKARARQILKSH